MFSKTFFKKNQSWNFIFLYDINKYIVLPYPWKIHSQTPNGCLKAWTIPNPIYTKLFPTHKYP